MKYVEDRVLKDGIVINDDILKVDSFLNHQIDPYFVRKVGEYFAQEFKDIKVDRILTIETSGVAFAISAAMAMNDIPVVFAKKSKSKIVDLSNVYTGKILSFTRGIESDVTVDKRFLKKNENVLIIDDFLADGNAALGLMNLCNQANANVVGIGVVIDKAFQGGRKKLTDMGIKLVSCASIKAFKDGKPVF